MTDDEWLKTAYPDPEQRKQAAEWMRASAAMATGPAGTCRAAAGRPHEPGYGPPGAGGEHAVQGKGLVLLLPQIFSLPPRRAGLLRALLSQG